MKKLMSILLCVALLTGVCAAAVAQKDSFPEEEWYGAVKKIGLLIDAAQKNSVEMCKKIDDLRFYKEYDNVVEAHKTLTKDNNKIKEILDNISAKVSIDKADYLAAVEVAKSAHGLLPTYQCATSPDSVLKLTMKIVEIIESICPYEVAPMLERMLMKFMMDFLDNLSIITAPITENLSELEAFIK